VALEALLILPLFVALLFALVELTAIVSAEEQLCRASHQAARAAGHGACHQEICDVARRCLGHGPLGCHHEVKVFKVIGPPGNEHLVHVNNPEHLPPRTQIVVIVEADRCRVTPGLLRSLGIRLCDDKLEGSTTIWKE
jgi:hypothetical protein